MDHGFLKRGLNQMDCDSVNWWIRWMECVLDGSWNCEARLESNGCDSVNWWIRWMEFESDGKWNSEARPESGG